ncbi:MAG: UDP-N-acetylglucosamine 2-epimerase [Ignavibacteria bacterium GWA2_35_9]|nr:MAG: UDP-N-acetylglucosamine 2-epimerase [Ignavibacteria bacterium GWA2_35_9]OGU47910.1 MAG: UDP-N-acetylglucosamine 2-epimerase [Ignavibacteria bacterium GWB2_36_8]OGU48743.1 MAG: UDP-N-acetylglucosamine 2-epimerase [Ignavibacteria bacterium GWC2_36_12]
MKSKKISIIFGTRPEAIKLAPVILELRKYKEFEVNVCVTAQHREMLDQVLEVFDLKPEVDLDIMRANQTLSGLTSQTIKLLDNYLSEYKPDIILVQGDTTTVFAASLAAFYHKIKIGHVEAGLRTWNKFSPYPEEINRVLTTKLADLHFAPTNLSKENLLKDGVCDDQIFVTGNTVIDALLIAREKIKTKNVSIPGLPINLLKEKDNNMILITGHRRENFGEGFDNICNAIVELAEEYRDYHFIYPVHLNPNVRKPVFEILSRQKNIFLIEPLNYLPFIFLMDKAKIILTDSGGVQEEAPSLGKPVLVMRDTTERPEGVDAGTVKIVGTQKQKIVEETKTLLNNQSEYLKMANAVNPYGDGLSSLRIKDILLKQI